MPVSHRYRASRAHAVLGGCFFDPVSPARFPQAILRFRNQRWAARVGLDPLTDEEWIAAFARFEPLPDGFERPLALRYHGHQFQSYNPELGDGRGFLFAQLHDLRDGRLLDLGTKGSGRTPYSRFGDGRLTLKGGLREILATEMLEAQGTDTSKTFSLVETGEALERHDEPSPTRSSVLVRLSFSHIRIGSFQRLLHLAAHEDIARLLDYVVETYLPEARRQDPGARALAFFDAVCLRVARTGAQWMAGGFVHGVLNTDNINVTGESFDYGPWRFAPALDPRFTAAYFDETGLYAFGRQPDALLWNLARLAECLLQLADHDALEASLARFESIIREQFVRALLWRLGLLPRDPESDAALASAFWSFLAATRAPFEQAFFDWRGGALSRERALRGPSQEFYLSDAFAPVATALADHQAAAADRLDHPYFRREKPCTMLIDEVEAIWAPIAEADDWSKFNEKLSNVREMSEAYGTAPETARFAD
jgi:serine/tyrosine/threonine adenylyltransferase